jgi:hypothetical protein
MNHNLSGVWLAAHSNNGALGLVGMNTYISASNFVDDVHSSTKTIQHVYARIVNASAWFFNLYLAKQGLI